MENLKAEAREQAQLAVHDMLEKGSLNAGSCLSASGPRQQGTRFRHRWQGPVQQGEQSAAGLNGLYEDKAEYLQSILFRTSNDTTPSSASFVRI